MRTTLNIDDDVLVAAKEMGRRTRKTAGEVISLLARESLTRSDEPQVRETEAFYGFRPLSRIPGRIVTNEMINKLRDEELM